MRLPGPLRELALGRATVDLDESVATVGQALEALRRAFPAVHDRIVTEQGEVRPHVNIFVGSESIRSANGLETPLADRTEITILPAVSGGG